MDIESLVNANGLSRLAFLRVAMGQYGIQRKDIAEKLGLNYTGVNRWFKVDDISISYIYRIAELYGLDVKVNLHPKSASQGSGRPHSFWGPFCSHFPRTSLARRVSSSISIGSKTIFSGVRSNRNCIYVGSVSRLPSRPTL